MSNNEIMVNEKTMNGLQRLIGIFISPKKVFESLKQKPNILMPMIVLPLVGLLYYLLFWGIYEIQLIHIIEEQSAKLNIVLTQENLAMQLTFSKIITLVGVVLGILIAFLLSALFYYIAAKIVKTKLSYKKSLSIVTHTGLIGLLSWIIMIVVTATTGEMFIEAPITSLASLLPETMSSTFIYGVCKIIEVFSIWSTCLAAFGLMIIGNLTKKQAVIIVIIGFAISALISGVSVLIT